MRETSEAGQTLFRFGLVYLHILRSLSKLIILDNHLEKGLRSMVKAECLWQNIPWGEARDCRYSGFNYRDQSIFHPRELAIFHVYWLVSDSYGAGRNVFK